MLFYRLLFLFRSFTFILIQEMIFFKKKSKKLVDKFKEMKSSTNPRALSADPPLKPPFSTQITTISSVSTIQPQMKSSLELTIPVEVSNVSVGIAQNPDQQIEATTSEKLVTIDSASIVEDPTELDSIRNSEPSVSSHSQSSLKKDASQEECVDNIIEVESSTSSTDKSFENQNAGDSLTSLEGGDIELVPDNQDDPLPVPTEAIEEIIVDTEKVDTSEKKDLIVAYSLIEKEDTDRVEDSTPCLGNDQLLLEQIDPNILEDEQELMNFPTVPTTIFIENSVFDTEQEEEEIEVEDKEIDFPVQVQECDQKLSQLEARSETAVGSLEIAASHQQQEINTTLKQDLIPSVEIPEKEDVIEEVIEEVNEEVVEKIVVMEKEVEKVCFDQQDTEKNTLDCTFKKNNNKADIVVKRRSGHSLIPRKQFMTCASEKAPAAIFSKAPVCKSSSNNSIITETKKQRRGSSGSLIPTFHQNRLSLVITETNFKTWSPSPSPDSPSSIRSSTSTSSSGSSTTHRKEKRLSLKAQQRLSNIPTMSHHSKIPVVGLNLVLNNVPKTLPSVSHVGSISKLPKRNSTIV